MTQNQGKGQIIYNPIKQIMDCCLEPLESRRCQGIIAVIMLSQIQATMLLKGKTKIPMPHFRVLWILPLPHSLCNKNVYLLTLIKWSFIFLKLEN